MWWTTILDWISGGLAGKVVEAYKARLDAGNTTDRIAADLASRDIAARQAIVQAELASWFTALPRVTIEMIFAVYIAKLVIWDKVLALGSTDALTGDLGSWASIVIGGMFGHAIAGRIAGIFTGR
ncbi:hypothetical protein EYW49_20485 [Siculibacillus lacustris]|uniref:Uncharacterized protein n=1 Tax=Siculibacillus lacustris TaxID=1549641 RepID=A0A4Q9VET4_9HYPH|nr:hypothetical protein [Siculibacillus lacustris]TBW33339.1 hypothetical protein EYW49_20485 [Siculibacillus lacustris]